MNKKPNPSRNQQMEESTPPPIHFLQKWLYSLMNFLIKRAVGREIFESSIWVQNDTVKSRGYRDYYNKIYGFTDIFSNGKYHSNIGYRNSLVINFHICCYINKQVENTCH